MTSEQLIELIDGTGYNARSYSGRGMFGKFCVAVTVPSAMNFAGKLVLEAFTRGIDMLEVCEVLELAQEDAMGRNRIIYWPAYSAEEETE